MAQFFDEILGFFGDLAVASFLILLTTLIHAIGLDRIMALVGPRFRKAAGTTHRHHIRKIKISILAIMGIFAIITIHIWIWAFAYQLLGVKEFKTLEDAVYFSTVSFTTLGFGDIVLKDHWRVLSGIEAANGIVLLGWSTAFLFEIMTAIYPRNSWRQDN